MVNPPPAVLVIGCGPVGLLAAYLLGRRGIPTLIIDKHHDRRDQPKAHALNPRSLEIFQQSGLDVPYLRTIGNDPRHVDVVRFVDKFYGWEYGSLSYERQFDDVTNLTPQPLLNIPQPAVEEYLLSEVSKLPAVSIQKGVEWLSAEQLPGDKIISKLVDRATQQEFSVETSYLLACDGGRSTLRSKFNIDFQSIDGGPLSEKHHVTVHFRADLPGKRSGILFFNMQARGVHAFIRYSEDEWVFVRRFDPAKESASDFDEATCHSIVQESLGKAESILILSITIWQSSTRIAEKYRVSNVFLAGDAAHTFPPTGGLGVNTGFADVHNLVWKLDAVLQGVASNKLLETYEAERRPVAIQNAGQSALNEEKMDQLGARINPGGVGQEPERLTDPTFQKLVQEGVQLNAPHFDSLDLQLGYVYGQPRDAEKSISCFQSTFTEGARLPHIYIDLAKKKSVLDLVDGCKFVLFSPTRELWSDVEQSMDATIRKWVKPMILGQDFDGNDGDAEWLHQMFTTGLTRAVLVRPDQHIAGFVESGSACNAMLRELFE